MDKTVNMKRIMLINIFKRNKMRLITIILSIVIGSSTVTALVEVYTDINVKMRKELRAYGANVIIRHTGISKKNQLNLKNVNELRRFFNNRNVQGYSPLIFGVADSGDNRFIVVGLDLKELGKLSPYIKIIKKIKKPTGISTSTAIIGKDLANKLNIKPGDKIRLKNSIDSASHSSVQITSVIESGNVEDDQLLVDTSLAQTMFKKDTIDQVNVSFAGSMDEINFIKNKISKVYSGITLSPINKISKSEGTILRKINTLTLFVSLVILLSTVLATTITLASMIYERRHEIGIKKAIGASDKIIFTEFFTEGLFAGLFGGVFGWILGIGIAQIISLSLFNSLISIRIGTVLITILVALLITSVSSVIPIKRALLAEPASILRNE